MNITETLLKDYLVKEKEDTSISIITFFENNEENFIEVVYHNNSSDGNQSANIKLLDLIAYIHNRAVIEYTNISMQKPLVDKQSQEDADVIKLMKEFNAEKENLISDLDESDLFNLGVDNQIRTAKIDTLNKVILELSKLLLKEVK